MLHNKNHEHNLEYKINSLGRTFWLFLIAISLIGVLLIANSAKADEVTIHLRFAITTPLGQFQDTLEFTEAQWASRKQADVDVAKQARADAWIVFMTDQIKQATAQAKQDRIVEIDTMISDLSALKSKLQDEIK